MGTNTIEKTITKNDLNKVFFRSLFIRSCLNFERQQNLGFSNAMSPIINKLYNNEEDRIEAYERHMQLFLTNPMMSGAVLGVTVAMEEEKSKGTGVTGVSIGAVKTALMSPLAALGDSLLSGTARPIVAGVAASLALSGSILGPILFFAVMSIISIGIKYYGVTQGYSRGINFVTDIQESGLIDRITELAGVAALVVIGGFIPVVVSLSTSLEYISGETVISLQEQLDTLIPGILPLGLTLFIYYLIRKTNLSAVSLIVFTMIIGIAGTYLGIF
ncbi:PTS system mannose/fructose/sorbose family transporter subunit IID [Carnobacteriaceae bacterium 52-44]